MLGAESLMTHLGSARGTDDRRTAVKTTIKALNEVLDGYRGTTRFLIEIAAGSGLVLGSTFEEIAEIVDALKVAPGALPVGVCFDTQHAFASGYDLRTKPAVEATLKKLDKTVGLERVVMSHANDSKPALGERKDRHEHIGLGQIGLEGFRTLVNHPKTQHWLFMLETPKDGKERQDIETLKSLRA
jgi:deoxyribonuclease-4